VCGAATPPSAMMDHDKGESLHALRLDLHYA
jgi:hypothetical protein